MSFVDVRERVRDSPERARSLLTVRAAISSARSSDLPCSFWLSLMCSYWRARLVPGFTPRGGMLGCYPEPVVCAPMAAELLIVGGGRMGEALLGGLLAARRTGLAVAEVAPKRREELSVAYPGVEVVEAPVKAAGAVLVVKPYDVASVARAVAEAGTQRVLSVAAGITTRAIEEAVG